MLAATHNQDDDHIRRLLDQRAQRAHVPYPHSPFPSFSDRSDSPSLYSHLSPATLAPNTPATYFRTQEIEDDELDIPPMSPRERLADPHASSLDLSDDFSDHHESVFLGDVSVEAADDDLDPRLSLMGPKMRFHSRAPWELTEDDVPEEDEEADAQSTRVFGGMHRGMRALGLGSRSERSSAASPRPSGESSASSHKAKSPPETAMSNGGNGAL